MEKLFLTVLSMSVTGAAVIVVVLLARLALGRAPKAFSYALWAVVLFRLLCPFAVPSDFSLLPVVHTASAGEDYTQVKVYTGIAAMNSQVNDYLSEHPYPVEFTPSEHSWNLSGQYLEDVGRMVGAAAPDWTAIACRVWLAGAAALLAYSLLSALRLRRRLTASIPLAGEKNVRLADHILSPFVLGLVRPRVYLPSDLPENERDYILLHERTHIRRCDHITRALAWLALVLHWFNPLVWLAFHLAGKDMEMSCDEAVLRKMGRDVRADYSSSLLRLSVGGKLPAGPLAFGGGDPQSRIKNVLCYKKPALWVIVAALIVVVCAGVALATNPGPVLDSPKPSPSVNHESSPTERWLDYLAAPEDLPWDDSAETQLPEFPDVTFRWTPGKLTALTGDGEMELLHGMPIWSVYFYDINGDGFRELCACVSYGSGMIDEHILVYDYHHSALHELWNRGVYDYTLRLEGDRLWAVERDYMGSAERRSGPLVLTDSGLDIQSQDPPCDTAPDDDLTLSVEQSDSGPFVRINGTVDGVVLTRGAFWYPETVWREDGSSELSMMYPAFTDGIEGHVSAWWTDETRTSVTLSTEMSAMLSSFFNVGWWEFTVDLDSGTVIRMEGLPFRDGLPDEETRFYPASITDAEAVRAARIAAKLLTAAEDVYRNRLSLRQPNGALAPAVSVTAPIPAAPSATASP